LEAAKGLPSLQEPVRDRVFVPYPKYRESEDIFPEHCDPVPANDNFIPSQKYLGCYFNGRSSQRFNEGREPLMNICSVLISSDSLSGKGFGKNSNLLRCFQFFDHSVDRRSGELMTIQNSRRKI